MRSLGVCAILLALAAVAPPVAQRGPFEGLWALGALVLLGVTLQNVLRRVRLPAVAGWIVAGTILGPSLFHVVDPLRVPLLALCFSVAGLWAGLLAGLGFSWPPARRGWRVPLVVAASTILTFGTVAAGISLTTRLAPVLVLILAALASMWGPLLADFWRSREVQAIGIFGAFIAFLVLSTVLAATGIAGGMDWAARLWLALLTGAVAGETLFRLRLLDHRGPALLSLSILTMVAALAGHQFRLPVLALGLGLGLVLAARQHAGSTSAAGTSVVSRRQLEHLLAPTRSTAILLFAALLSASTDVRMLWPLPSGLIEVLAVQIVALLLFRGLGPALWYPVPLDAEFSRRSAWLLLPRGLVTGALVLGAGASLPGLLATADSALLQAVVIADVLVFSLFFSVIAALVPAPSPTPPAVTETEAPETEPASA
jgi:hypothetical protein